MPAYVMDAAARWADDRRMIAEGCDEMDIGGRRLGMAAAADHRLAATRLIGRTPDPYRRPFEKFAGGDVAFRDQGIDQTRDEKTDVVN